MTEPTTDAQTVSVKYVFIDVVGFTANRSVEAQADIVSVLNTIVQTAATDIVGRGVGRIIYLPTGDGLCIAMLSDQAFDAHLTLALRLLKAISRHNQDTDDEMRRFDVRIGLAENVDNLVRDINAQDNLAGAGVAMARRVMEFADGQQVLMTDSVHSVLSVRERYLKSFRTFNAATKHGATIKVHQFVSDQEGLSTTTPSAFLTMKAPALRLSEQAAHFILLAIQHREFLLSRKGDHARNNAAAVLLLFMAEDAERARSTPSHTAPFQRTWKATSSTTFAEQYAYYLNQDTQLLLELARHVAHKLFRGFEHLFEGTIYQKSYAFPTTNAIEQVRQDWPELAS